MSDFTLTALPLRPAALEEAFDEPGAGALVVFVGRVRACSGGRPVVRLEYEAYNELACHEGERILAELRSNPGVLAVRVVHRTGGVGPGEPAIWVGVLAAHRGEAFEACRRIVDDVKHRVPIWKREIYADGGSVWVAGEGSPPRDGSATHGD